MVAFRTIFGMKCSTERYGENSWVVITGAASGLGREAAIKLAKSGFNIIVIGNS